MLKSIMMPQILRHRKCSKTHFGVKIDLTEDLERLILTFLYLSKRRVEVAQKGALQSVATQPWTQSNAIGRHRRNHNIFWKGVLAQ